MWMQKKWSPVILSEAAGGVKDLGYETGLVILNRVKDLGHGLAVTFIANKYGEVYQILR